MPASIIDRLPLPNLKVYTAGSVGLLSVSIYYALSVTSDHERRLNATLQRQEIMEGRGSEMMKIMQPLLSPVQNSENGTRNLTEQIVDVMGYMMQEPFCMWTVINMAYCSLALFGFLLQKIVFGKLRVSEAQRVKDKFWNYVFYKFICVFGVINVQYMDEVILWCSWFTIVGFLLLMTQLSKDRFDYLSSSPNTSRWTHVRLISLLSGIVCCSAALLIASFVWDLPTPSAGKDTFFFAAAECLLVLLSALHVLASYGLQIYHVDVAGPVAYYTHLAFDWSCLIVELMHVIHMVVWSNMLVSMASLVLLMQLRHLLHELQARLARHRLYTSLAQHMSKHYPMASKEEVEKNQDHCAICWEPMKEARKLPCSHLFHNGCLCQWMQQDASCPTCRRNLTASGNPALRPREEENEGIPAGPRPNHLFRFDASRYVSWLPSFSVEVTRVRPETRHAQIEAMARQVQQLFPQFTIGALTADLLITHSTHLTVENILEGRLVPTPLPLIPEAILSPSRPTAESARNSTTPERDSNMPHPAASLAEDLDDIELSDPSRRHFPERPDERENMLRRRKELLIANARKRYLEKYSSSSSDAGSSTQSPHS